jgi:HlyD family secretion protein
MAMDIARPSRKKEIRRRRIILSSLGIAALALVTWGLSTLEPAAREVDRAAVWSGKVHRGEFLRSVRGPGTLVPVEIRWIYPETEGLVEDKVIESGAQVEADTVILVLSNPELTQRAGDAELALKVSLAELADLSVRLDSQMLDQQANLAQVEAQKESAELQAEANKQLWEEGLLPVITHKQSELTAKQLAVRFDIEKQRLEKTAASIEAQMAVRRTQVDQARAVYQLRKDQLAALVVRAGIRGVLQDVPVEEGQRVATSTILARVAQPEKLKAELRIPETQAKDILIGQTAKVDTRNGIVTGQVSRIDPAVQNGSVLVDVRLNSEELPKGARPDLSVDGIVELERVADALQVSRPAYGQSNQTIGLFKIGADDIAVRVQVQLGRLSVQSVEILAGLNEGDEVILSDSSQWDDVDRIRLRE